MTQPETRRTIPTSSLIFGYGPMIPFVLGAIGTWSNTAWHSPAMGLTIIWGGLILSFVAGVRRGFGFGHAQATLMSELVAMMSYFSMAGATLILAWLGYLPQAISLLALGFGIVAIADYRAAKAGDAPAHFAKLRPPQMAIAVLSLLAILAWFVAPR